MIKNERRRTDRWFVDKEFVGKDGYKSGPGAYNFHEYQPKQSWNKGSVPFGSKSNLENGSMFTFETRRGVRCMPTINSGNPGPG